MIGLEDAIKKYLMSVVSGARKVDRIWHKKEGKTTLGAYLVFLEDKSTVEKMVIHTGKMILVGELEAKFSETDLKEKTNAFSVAMDFYNPQRESSPLPVG